MAKNIWCIAKSHPLVRQIAEKYNVSKERAKTIINTARKNDASLNDDNLELDYLETQQAFKDAVKVFNESFLEVKDHLVNDPGYGVKMTKELLNEIRDELGIRMSEDEVEDHLRKIKESAISIGYAKVSARNMANVISAFRDAKRLDYVGQWLTSYYNEIVNALDTSDEVRKSYGIERQNRRSIYFTDDTIEEKIKDRISAALEGSIDYLKDVNPENAKELEAAYQYMDTILFLYGSKFDDEGIRVNPEGKFYVPEETKISDDNDSDAGEETNDGFNVDDQNVSARDKMVPVIKRMLNTLRDIDQDGNEKPDPYGYYLWSYLPGNYVTNKIHEWLIGARTQGEMMERLKNNISGNPWVQNLINTLNGDKNNSKQEQLRTQFFESARMQHTAFRETFEVIDENGDAITVTRNTNLKRAYTQMKSKLVSKFNRMKGLRILKDGKINFHEIYKMQNELTQRTQSGTSIEDRLYNAYQIAKRQAAIGTISNEKQDFSEAFDELNKAKQQIKKTLEGLGVFITNEQLNDFVNNNPDEELYDDSFYGSDANFGDKQLQIQHLRLTRLRYLALNIISMYDTWNRDIYNRTAGTPDASTNPFSDRVETQAYPNIKKVNWAYNVMFQQLSRFAGDTYELRKRIDGKDYNAINHPSIIQTIIENLSTRSLEERQRFIMDKFGKDAIWFLKQESKPGEPHFYSDVLEDLYYGRYVDGNGDILAYSEKPSSFEKPYSKLSKKEYNKSLLNDFFQGQEGDPNAAWYRTLISSDKNRYSLIRLRKYTRQSSYEHEDGTIDKDYRTEITDKAIDFFGQELRRAMDVVNNALNKNATRYNNYDLDVSKDSVKKIVEKIKAGQDVTIEDVTKNGKYIFSNTGAGFFFNKFLNNEIARNTELGRYLVDRIFNQAKHAGEKIVTEDAAKLFRSGFRGYMLSLRDEYLNELNKCGLTKPRFSAEQTEDGIQYVPHISMLSDMLNWHRNDEYFSDIMYGNESDELIEFAKEQGFDFTRYPHYGQYAQELFQFEQDIECYTYNNWLAKANTIEIVHVDPAFYKNTPNLQKRAMQQMAAGVVADPDARVHGEQVSDEFYRSITIKTNLIESSEIKHIKQALYSELNKIQNSTIKSALKKEVDSTLGKLKKMDTTDGQGLVGLTSLRKRLADRGSWSRSVDKNWDKMGYYFDENNKRIYVFTDEAVYQRIKRGYKDPVDREVMKNDFLHVFEQPQKDFVKADVNTQRKGRGTITVPTQHKNSEAALIYLSAFIQGAAPESKLAGIAHFLEYTVEHNDNNDARQGIDTVNWDSAVKIGGNNRAIDLSKCKTGQDVFEALKKAVYEKGTDNYKKDGTVTVYDKQSYRIIQQNPEEFKDNPRQLGSQVKIHSISNLDDDKTYTLPSGEQITGRELKREYFAALKEKTRRSYNDLKRELGFNLPFKERLYVLADSFRKIMESDSRFTSEARRNLTITERNGVTQFVLPLDDAGQQLSVEANIIAKTRNAFFRAKSNGGIVVQATSWDSSNDLHIRFYDKQGALLLTEKEYLETHNDGNYEAYRAENQGDYAYMEMEVTMPSYVRAMLEKKHAIEYYLNDDGTWDMDKIRADVPASVFDAICYRIPTEAKYSIMACKIKRFTPELDTAARYPAEITTFTGSDFDIDKDFIELRPKPGNRDEDVDNKIFDLQLAALTSSSGLLESFKSGDFSDISEISYRHAVALSGQYGKEQIDAMSISQLKELCEEIENIDFMGLAADSALRAQNMEAKDMIAIAAVSAMSHSMFSNYNVQMKINPSIKGSVSEMFTIVDDVEGPSVKFKKFGGYNNEQYVDLDPQYDINGNLISSQLSKYVGGSADAIKEPALFRLNITTTTLPIVAYMQRIGIPKEIAIDFISNPVIRELTSRIGERSNFGYSTVEDVCDKMVEEIARENSDADTKYQNIRTSDDNQLIRSQLEKDLYGGIPLERTLTYIHLYANFAKLAEQLRNLDGFIRYNSSTAMKGSTFIDRYAKRRSIEKLIDNLNKEKPRFKMPGDIEIQEGYEDSNYGRLCSMFPYIADTISGENEIEENIILDNMPTYNSTFFRAVNTLEIQEKPELMKQLYSGLKNYLLFVGSNRIVDFWDPRVVRYYTRDFANHYYDTMQELEQDAEFYNRVVANNTFLSSIEEKESDAPFALFGILGTDIMGLRGQALEKYQNDWADLLNYSQTRKLAIDLGIYFLARKAAFSNDTPVTVMPTAIKEAIPNYINAHTAANTEKMTESEFSQFMMSFLLNNTNNADLIPYIGNTPDEEVIKFKDGKIWLNEEYFEKLAPYFFSFYRENTTVHKLKLPVIGIQDGEKAYLYAVANSNFMTEEEIGGKKWLTIEAKETEPLGIPNQFSEYTGLPMTESIFSEETEGHDNVVYPKSTKTLETISTIERINMGLNESNGFFVGRRSGTYVQSLPFGEDEYAENVTDTAISRTTTDFSNNPYLESRIHLRRTKQLAEFLGIKLGTITRSSTIDGPAYNIGIPVSREGDSYQEQLSDFAALISSLGFGKAYTNPAIKTYITNPNNEDFNVMELSIKLGDDVKARRLARSLAKDTADVSYEIDSDANELRLSVFTDGSPDIQARLRKAVLAGYKIIKDIRDNGGVIDGKIEVNYANVEYVDVRQTLNNLSQYAKQTENYDTGTEAQATSVPEGAGDRDGREVRLSDIVTLAQRRQAGEKVNSDLRNLFGETRQPLRNADISYSSQKLADTVYDIIQEDAPLLREITSLVNSNDEEMSNRQVVENLIINTANWIIGNRPMGIYGQMAKKINLSKEGSEDIVEKIKSVLDELNIC